MNSRSCLQNRWGALTLGLLLALAAPLFADTPYLAAGHPDGVALLAPPPVPGSAEEATDLAATRAAFQGRTPAEQARAVKDSTLSFALFAPVIGPVFRPGKLPKTEALLQKVKSEIGDAINISKDYWKRLRPYQMDENLSLGTPEPSFGYPSGHSTRGTVYASLVADLFPKRKRPS